MRPTPPGDSRERVCRPRAWWTKAARGVLEQEGAHPAREHADRAPLSCSRLAVVGFSPLLSLAKGGSLVIGSESVIV